jgi:hypothetical protein
VVLRLVGCVVRSGHRLWWPCCGAVPGKLKCALRLYVVLLLRLAGLVMCCGCCKWCWKDVVQGLGRMRPAGSRCSLGGLQAGGVRLWC